MYMHEKPDFEKTITPIKLTILIEIEISIEFPQ